MAAALPAPVPDDTRQPMSLREKQKNERRQRILDAAEKLIRASANSDFAMRQLAVEAEVSPATPFNLFGSKEGLLYALLARSLDRIMSVGLRFRGDDAARHVLQAGENAVMMFLNDPDLLRPLYQVLLSVSHPEHRPEFMARTFAYWHAAARTVPTAGPADALVTDAVAGALMAHFIGLLELWVHRDLDDAAFLARTEAGIILIVLSLLPDRQRKDLQALLARIARAPADDPDRASAKG